MMRKGSYIPYAKEMVLRTGEAVMPLMFIPFFPCLMQTSIQPFRFVDKQGE